MADQENMEGNSADEEMEYVSADSDSSDDEGKAPKVYLPTKPIAEGEELVMNDTAYIMYHEAQTGAPCLSFDVVPDSLGEKRETFPLTSYCVAGTQAERSHTNNVIVFKMSNLQKNKTAKKPEDDEESDASDADDEEEDDDDVKPVMETAMIKHNGGVNRIRCTELGGKKVAATWSETGKVHIWDLSRPLLALDDPQVMASYTRNQESPAAMFTFTGHQVEGFAVDWCKTTPGRLATGDCNKNIHIWNPSSSGWHVDQRPYVGHTASVEDIQWSPNEQNVFASCSVDKSVRVWDARAAPSKACMITAAEAHERDVNVITWNKSEPFIISGGDDGVIKVWDLRQIQSGTPVALFKHHTQPITSVEWNPSDSTVFAASGSDDQVSIWDLAVERDPGGSGGGGEEEGMVEDVAEVPPQLLFIHQGQKDIKELHWHPQLPGVLISTAHSGFNVFRTISV